MRGLTRFLRHWQNWLGLVIVAVFVGVALAAPRLAPPAAKDSDPAFHLIPTNDIFLPIPPSAQFPLGTFPLDRFSQVAVLNNVIWGARGALSFGLVVALLTATIGVLLGAIGGYAGGWVNTIILRVTDAFLTFPTVVAVVLISQLMQLVIEEMNFLIIMRAGPEVLGPMPGLLGWLQNTNPALIAFVLFSWMPYARLTNSMVLRLRQVAFIEATRALGASPARIILRHLIPNAISPSLVLVARDIGGLVLLQATLTYIGLPAGSEWGAALRIASRWVIGPGGNPLARWWVFLPATLAIILFGIGWNLLGDGLNDWLNPRSA